MNRARPSSFASAGGVISAGQAAAGARGTTQSPSVAHVRNREVACAVPRKRGPFLNHSISAALGSPPSRSSNSGFARASHRVAALSSAPSSEVRSGAESERATAARTASFQMGRFVGGSFVCRTHISNAYAGCGDARCWDREQASHAMAKANRRPALP
jgi:hypothetical protein